MTIVSLYTEELSKRASAGTQHRFFNRYNVEDNVKKLFNTVYALSSIEPHHTIEIDGDHFKRDDYSLPDAMNIAVWNGRVFMSKDDAGRCEPVFYSTVEPDPELGYLSPKQVKWFIDDYNSNQAESHFKITLVPTKTDRSFGFQDLRDVAISGSTYQFSGSTDVEELSLFLNFDSPLSWDGLVNHFSPVNDKEVVKWLLNT